VCICNIIVSIIVIHVAHLMVYIVGSVVNSSGASRDTITSA
jgi:hypothetical protein